jgi:hypothetical protein
VVSGSVELTVEALSNHLSSWNGTRPTALAPPPPRISNFRIEPAEVEEGGQVTLRFDFLDDEGDIVDVYLGVSAEIKHFTLATGLRSAVISRGRYFGQTQGTAEETIRITIDPPPHSFPKRDFDGGVASPNVREGGMAGVRVYKIFVVNRKGDASNVLRERVTIRPSSTLTQGGPHVWR